MEKDHGEIQKDMQAEDPPTNPGTQPAPKQEEELHTDGNIKISVEHDKNILQNSNKEIDKEIKSPIITSENNDEDLLLNKNNTYIQLIKLMDDREA